MSNPFEFTSKQIAFLIIGAMIGTGILSLPRTVASKAHQDVALAILLGAVIPLASLLLINYLAKQHQGQDFTSVTHQLFGKWLGSIILLLFVIYTICFEGIIIRIFADVTGMYLLRRTPLIVLLVVMNMAVFYICSRGGKVVARITELLFYVLFFNFILVLFPLSSFQLTNLLPVGEAGLKNILEGAKVTAYSYGGIECMLAGAFLIQRPREFLRAGMIAIGTVVAAYLLVTVVCIGVYGHDAVLNFIFPVITLFKSVEVSIFERLELFFLITWVGLGIRPAIIFNMFGSHTLTRMLGLDVKRFYPYMVAVISGLSLAFAIIPRNIIEVFEFANIVGNGVFAVALGYPLIYIIAGFIRKVG